MTAANALLFIAGAVASTAAVAVAVARCEIGTQRIRTLGVRIVIRPYHFALLPAALTAVTMAVTLAGTLCWGIIARHVAPHAFTPSTLLAWLVIVVAMTLATLVASVGVIRGYAANTAPAVARR